MYLDDDHRLVVTGYSNPNDFYSPQPVGWALLPGNAVSFLLESDYATVTLQEQPNNGGDNLGSLTLRFDGDARYPNVTITDNTTDLDNVIGGRDGNGDATVTLSRS